PASGRLLANIDQVLCGANQIRERFRFLATIAESVSGCQDLPRVLLIQPRRKTDRCDLGIHLSESIATHGVSHKNSGR
ncbi:MAG: hypothetical protein ACR2N1_05325, partial [Rubripirellula sp.]